MPRSGGIRLLVCVGDLHCGSRQGLLPPGVQDAEGAVFRLNEFQEWAWGRYTDFIKWKDDIVAGDPHDLVVNGDLPEGPKSADVVSHQPNEQRQIAIECIKPLAKDAASLHIVKGTRYHVGVDEEQAIAHELGTTACWRLPLCYHQSHGRITHHIGVTGIMRMESGAPGRELVEEQARAGVVNRPMIRWIVRSHRHIFGYYGNAYGLAVALPAWQAHTEYVHKVMPSVEECVVGGCILDWRGLEPDSVPRLHSKVWPQPPMKVLYR